MIDNVLFRTLENPEALQLFGIGIQSLYWKSFFLVLGMILLLFAWYSVYILLKKTSSSTKKQKLAFNGVKTSLLCSYEKGKSFLFSSRYLLIWAFLQLLSWNFVKFIFTELSLEWSHPSQNGSLALNRFLGNRTAFSLLIFMIAPYFITFCFGNKLVRNLGILTYIFWIWFLFFGFLLQLGTF